MIRIVCDFPFTVYGKNVTRLIIRGVSPGSIAKEGPNVYTVEASTFHRPSSIHPRG